MELGQAATPASQDTCCRRAEVKVLMWGLISLDFWEIQIQGHIEILEESLGWFELTPQTDPRWPYYTSPKMTAVLKSQYVKPLQVNQGCVPHQEQGKVAQGFCLSEPLRIRSQSCQLCRKSGLYNWLDPGKGWRSGSQVAVLSTWPVPCGNRTSPGRKYPLWSFPALA